MCIAIFSPMSAPAIPESRLRTCMEHNPDGMGVVYAHAGKLRVYRTLTDFDAWYTVYRQAVAVRAPALLHFRIATHGAVTLDNTHPFFVPGADPAIAVIHNGILENVHAGKTRSDTRALVEDVLANLPPGWWDSLGIEQLLEDFVYPSKVVMLDALGQARIFNEAAGHWFEGSWYSNDSYLKAKADEPPLAYLVDDQLLCPRCAALVPDREAFSIEEIEWFGTDVCDACWKPFRQPKGRRLINLKLGA